MKAWVVVILPLLLTSCIGPRYYYIRKNSERGVYHKIEPGLTLWRISRAYGIDLDSLARVNRLEDVTEIESGAYLFIPGADKTLKIAPYTEQGTQTLTRKDDSGETKFIWPLRGKLSSPFGMRNGRKHEGIDISAPAGTDIKASAEGTVTQSGWGPGDYGKAVMITHENGFVTLYGHNLHNTVSEGAKVSAGQVIGRVGKTGNATGYHLHFEIRKNGTPVNPLFFLP